MLLLSANAVPAPQTATVHSKSAFTLSLAFLSELADSG